MNNHRSIQHTVWPIGYVPLPKRNEADYNKRMKSATARFNNWAKYIHKSVKHN